MPDRGIGAGSIPIPIPSAGESFWRQLFSHAVPGQLVAPLDTVYTEEDLKKYIAQRAKEYRAPDLNRYKVGEYWRSLGEQAKVTSVVSGKGGVGKTSISLGLTEYYSEREKVLLVDFDLHNRGLTSKYGTLAEGVTTVFSEMRRFRQTVLTDERMTPKDGAINLAAVSPEIFHDLRAKFAYESYPQLMTRHPLALEYLYSESVRLQDIVRRTRPGNCYFLPSRRGSDSFLGSVESQFDVAQTAIFVTYLSHLAHRYGIERVILDCHGAHDLFMVGAILASEHVIIVTKPEPAAFEGTIELIRFAESVVESNEIFPSTKVLVFNEYRQRDAAIAQALHNGVYEGTASAMPFEQVPKIEYSDELINTYKYYKSPCLLDLPGIGEQIRKMTQPGAKRTNHVTALSSVQKPTGVAAERIDPGPTVTSPSPPKQ